MTGAEVRLWLIGEGIAASPSPAMQRAALRARALPGSYDIVDVDAAGLPGVLDRMRGGEVTGANVTVPHKGAVAAACDRLEGDAVVTHAVNTVVVEAGRLVGANTDAMGLEAALREESMWPAPGALVVVLGAGGAAAAAVLAMGRVPADRVVVTARRHDAAVALARRLAGCATTLAIAWDRTHLAEQVAAADVVINATPAPLGDLPLHATDLAASAAVVDLRYRPRPVDLVAAAQAAGLRACDGTSMLLHQGMLSFRRWTGAEPPWDEARAALRAAVDA